MLARSFSTPAYTAIYSFETLQVSSPCEHVLQVELYRPSIRNAMNKVMLREILECFKRISEDKQWRTVVLTGSSADFSIGLDFNDMAGLLASIINKPSADKTEDLARKAKYIRSLIVHSQDSFLSLEQCSKPVIAAIHGSCQGAAISLVAAADIRFCSSDTLFQVKEVNLAITPDMGTIQRLPKIGCNDSLVREMIYTGQKLTAAEAKEVKMLSHFVIIIKAYELIITCCFTDGLSWPNF